MGWLIGKNAVPDLARAFPEPVDKFPDYELLIDGKVRRVTNRALIERPMHETEEQKKARAKSGAVSPTVSYVVGRIVW